MIGVHSKNSHHPLLDEAVVEEEAKPPEDEGWKVLADHAFKRNIYDMIQTFETKCLNSWKKWKHADIFYMILQKTIANRKFSDCFPRLSRRRWEPREGPRAERFNGVMSLGTPPQASCRSLWDDHFTIETSDNLGHLVLKPMILYDFGTFKLMITTDFINL